MADERKSTIVVLRLDRIGDLILSGPFLVELRTACPSAHIVLAVTTTVAPLARRLPLVDEILTTPDLKTRWFGRVRRLVDRHRLIRALRPQRPDLIVVPRWDFDHYGALEIVRRVGAPASVGFTEAAKRLQPTVFTRAVDAPAAEHEALKPLRLLPDDHHLDWPELEHPRWYNEEDVRAADALLASADGPLIIFGIGADEDRKVWPAERFALSAIALCEDFGAVAVVVGSRDEGPTATRFAAIAPNCVNLVGATSLPVAAAVIARSALYVGNDSGPMHLAAAAGVPVVEISCHPRSGGPEHRYSPARFGPRPGPAAILQPAVPATGCGPSCSAREPHCILATSVEEVVSAGRQLLSSVPSSATRDHGV